MSSKSPQIGLVLPAFNEAKVIGKVLKEIPRSLKIGRKKYKVSVIVINDGSIDKTASVVKKNKRVILINHIINLGAGAATRTGLDYAYSIGCDYVATMDSDGQHQLSDVKKVLSEIIKGKADFVIGSRLINTKGMPWYRIVGNKFLNFVTFLLFGVFVTDSQSGLKAFNKKSLERITYNSNNYAFCSEMIWQAKRRKLKIKEVPIKAIYTDYSLAKGQSNLDVIHIMRQLLKQRMMDLLNG